MVIISLFAIIFPGFFISIYFPYNVEIVPFEPSIWLIPVSSFSFVFLVLGFEGNYLFKFTNAYSLFLILKFQNA